MVIRGLLIVVALMLFVLFSIPLVKGIVNIGNITGLTVGVICIAVAIFLDPMIRLSDQKVFKIVYAVVSVLILAIAALGIITGICISRGSQSEPPEGAVLVVLGCQVKGDKPSLMLAKRIDRAEVYLREHPETIAILSGGKGNGEDMSEAECMYRTLMSKGIAEERLIKEDRSMSTVENLEFTTKILEEKGLGRDIAIVTNEFHQYRAGEIAKSLDLNSGAVPSETAWWLWPTFEVREMYAVLAQWIK